MGVAGLQMDFKVVDVHLRPVSTSFTKTTMVQVICMDHS